MVAAISPLRADDRWAVIAAIHATYGGGARFDMIARAVRKAEREISESYGWNEFDRLANRVMLADLATATYKRL